MYNDQIKGQNANKHQAVNESNEFIELNLQ